MYTYYEALVNDLSDKYGKFAVISSPFDKTLITIILTGNLVPAAIGSS